MSELGANLVFATCEEFNLQQACLGSKFGEWRVFEDRFFCSAGLGSNDAYDGILFVLQEPVVECDSGMMGQGGGMVVGDNGPIGFADISIAKLFGESSGRFAGASDDGDTGDGFIESADDSKKNVPRFLIFSPDVLSSFIEQ